MLFSHARWSMKIGILGTPFNGDGTRPEIEDSAAAWRLILGRYLAHCKLIGLRV